MNAKLKYDFLEEAARRVHSMPHFKWAQSEKVTGGFLLGGAGIRLIVTKEELEKQKLIYETETGNCCECYGIGKRKVSWNIETGWKFEICKKCGGSGNAI